MNDLTNIFTPIKLLMQAYRPPLAARRDEPGYFDLWSETPVMIAGRKHEGVFFAGLIIRKDYVGFYYMPIYTDTQLKDVFPPELLKLLKGKSCFHIKKLDDALLAHIESALRLGFEMYQKYGWIAPSGELEPSRKPAAR